MFEGENRRLKILLVSGIGLIAFVFLFLQAVGGLIDSGSSAQPDIDSIAGVGSVTSVARTATSLNTTGSKCTVSRGPLPDVTCTPTPDQVSAATGIPVPPNAAEFTSTYEAFQDWRLEAAFVVTDPAPYLSLVDFPGLSVGGGEVQAKQAADGSYRNLELIAQPDGTTRVELSAFTT